MDHPLKTPLTFGKTTISKLTFRDYTIANDYLAFDKKGGVAQNIALIASMTGCDEALIGQLRGPDYIECSRICDKMISDDDAQTEASIEKKSLESSAQ